MVSPPTIAVIGCGPSGMSFLHALEVRRQQYENQKNTKGLDKLPLVTVYERNALPGGVWRSSKNNDSEEEDDIQLKIKVSDDPVTVSFDEEESTSDSSSTSDDALDETESTSDSSSDSDDEYIIESRGKSSTNMYEALWTNGPSHCIEYPDYTFDEHFNRPVPVFMPRGVLLEYMLARVTKNNPNFFDSVKFNTNVEFVAYDESMKKFKITSLDIINNQKTIEYFDKCIWAAGFNGLPKVPKSIRTTLQQGGFTGMDLHSCEAAKYLDDMKEKHIVMIGDSYSAEDLALQAIKLGVGKITVIARSGTGPCSYMSAWPKNKVNVISDHTISAVIQNGGGLRLVHTEDCDSVLDLFDVVSVIYCTGYEGNFDMISPDLDEDESEEYVSDLPSDWIMEPNVFTEAVGNVKPAKKLQLKTPYYFHLDNEFFKGIYIKNQNLMYLCEAEYDVPLLEIDIRAWYYAAIIMGDIILSPSAMIERNRQLIHDAMQIPCLRYYMDKEYKDKLDGCYDSFSVIEDDFDEDSYRFCLLDLAREAKEANHPLSLVGSSGNFNDKGELLLKMQITVNYYHEEIEESDWKTFRDIDPTGFMSLHTGQSAIPLKTKWLHIDDNDPDLI